MNFDSKDPLWDLLGKVRQEEPSPWLATRVVAAVREAGPRAGWLGRVAGWFRPGVLRPLCAGLSLVVVMAVIGVTSLPQRAPRVNGEVNVESGQLALALAAFEEAQLADDLGVDAVY